MAKKVRFAILVSFFCFASAADARFVRYADAHFFRYADSHFVRHAHARFVRHAHARFASSAKACSDWSAKTCSDSSANTLVVQLGEQDFADGVGVPGSDAFNVSAVGEPAPFDQFYSDDLSGPPFDQSWTFNFLAQSYQAATFTLGIFDHDSQAPGSQVSFFGFDGNDLTALLDTAFESSGGRQAENNIYTLDIPVAALADLSDGSALFTLALQGPSLAGAPLTDTPRVFPGNGAGLDFARLDLTVGAVPVPAAVWLFGTALLGLAGFSKRRKVA